MPQVTFETSSLVNSHAISSVEILFNAHHSTEGTTFRAARLGTFHTTNVFLELFRYFFFCRLFNILFLQTRPSCLEPFRHFVVERLRISELVKPLGEDLPHPTGNT